MPRTLTRSMLSEVDPIPGQAIAHPDAGFAALPRLKNLRDLLIAASPHAKPRASRWAEGRLFFFDRARQANLEAARAKPSVPSPALEPLAKALAEEVDSMCRSVEVRRVARAIPGLRQAVCQFLIVEWQSSISELANNLIDLLATPDDETILILHPAERRGYRIHVRGVSDARQFQVLMAEVLGGDSTDSVGSIVPQRIVAAYRDVHPVSPAGIPMIVEARFHLVKPAALLPDGTLPPGFRSSDHWLWGWQPLAALPRMGGERVVLLDKPAYPHTWEVERRFPSMIAEMTLLQRLNPFQVAEELGKLTGTRIPIRVVQSEPTPLARAA